MATEKTSSKATRTQQTATAELSTQEESKEYSIDELARVANSTVRNVRAYQDRGLIPPPEKRGRKGIYTSAHLARLRLITQLLERGYTMANINELMETWEKGQDLGQLLGLEQAVTSPFDEEIPDLLTLPQLAKKYGMKLDPSAFAKAIKLGIVERKGVRVKVNSPRMLHAGAELVRAGIPLAEMLDIVSDLRGNVERVANSMVSLVAKHIIDQRLGGDDQLPPADKVPELADVIWRLRPLVQQAVMPEVARAMELALRQELGDRLTVIMEHLNQQEGLRDF